MGPSLIAQWRRRFVSRGALVAALLAVPVLFAAVAGIGIGPGGLGAGVGALIGGPSAQDPDEATALASADDLGTGVAGLATTPPAAPADTAAATGPGETAPPGSTTPPSGGAPDGGGPGPGAPGPGSPPPPTPPPPDDDGDDRQPPSPGPGPGPVEELLDRATRPVPDPPSGSDGDITETIGKLADELVGASVAP